MMRKPNVAVVAARSAPQATNRSETPEKLVCLALLLAMLAIAFRLISIW
jgi:hypothetical protein